MAKVKRPKAKSQQPIAHNSRLTTHNSKALMFRISFVLSVLLIVGGFFCPPIGVIDGSVLTAVGLLLMYSIVGKLPEAIKAGKSVKIQKGDFVAEVGVEQ